MLAVFAATWIRPIWPAEQTLHCSLTLAGLAVLWRHLRQHPMSDRDFFLIALFIITHTFAARWLYSNVPYDRWLTDALGFSFERSFGWTRNNFDRLVHFMYGACLTPAIAAHIGGRFALGARQALTLTVGIIMISSLCYEWFEWLVAVCLSPADAESYNGQQGDMWDAHKDMLAATAGSLLWGFSSRRATRRDSPAPP
ncbi:DUF2238 domain-containing protein [Niveibacterium sp. 24ML]|uniref:DUF2238 domain-containing protein n=1 Tax=Niveibacterium sp. 24ML TaxID=2985512 RepID=UPI002270208D|nr:DUF2238 domain-containing protein [Niveibacterium sp. 24ML]MCX9156410.1 DUF2238 domain-containing protein [Niveibacterium sp. 24ML]